MKIESVFADLPVLETNRLILRKLTPNDVQDMFEYCSDEEISRFTTWHSHEMIEDTRVFLNKVLEQYNAHKAAPWAIEEKQSGKMIGTTGYIWWDTKNAKAEVGYALSRAYWNRGFMSEAVSKMIAFGFERMDLVRIIARCHPENTGSARVMEKTGMTFEGILRKDIFSKGTYEDVKIYSIIKDEYLKTKYKS